MRHRKRAEAELAAVESVEGIQGGVDIVGGDDDKAPKAGEEQGWLDRQLKRLENLRDRASKALSSAGDSARGGVSKVARGIERAAKRGLSAARSVLPQNNLAEKLKKGFKGLMSWAATMSLGSGLVSLALVWVAYEVFVKDERAREYYRR